MSTDDDFTTVAGHKAFIDRRIKETTKRLDAGHLPGDELLRLMEQRRRDWATTDRLGADIAKWRVDNPQQTTGDPATAASRQEILDEWDRQSR